MNTIQHPADPGANSRMPLWMGLVAGVLGFAVSAVLFVQSILRSTNSTAAIGFLYVPAYAMAYSVPAFVAGWCLGYLLTWRRSQTKRHQAPLALTGIVLIGISAWTFRVFRDGQSLSRQVHQIQGMRAGELESVLNRADLAGNKFVLGAIALNPNATSAILHRIVSMKRPDLHERMGSLFDVLGQNTKGLAVMRLIAMHPNTSSEDLERLAVSTNEYVLGDVAGNAKLSELTLRKLADRGGYLIEWGLAQNRSTPKDILSRLAESGNEYTRANVAANPSTPLEVLSGLSKDRIWHVRQNAALNPSTAHNTVEQLMLDSDQRVKRAAAANVGAISFQQ